MFAGLPAGMTLMISGSINPSDLQVDLSYTMIACNLQSPSHMLQSSHANLCMIRPALIKHIGTKQSFLSSNCAVQRPFARASVVPRDLAMTCQGRHPWTSYQTSAAHKLVISDIGIYQLPSRMEAAEQDWFRFAQSAGRARPVSVVPGWQLSEQQQVSTHFSM